MFVQLNRGPVRWRGPIRGILMDNPSNVQDNGISKNTAKRAALYIGILAFALVLLLFLGAGQASADEVTSDITVDTTWTSGGVYNISADVTVVDGVTLEIQNNVTVMFNGTYYLLVEGTMYVNGTADQPVVFTNNASLGYGGGIEYADGSSGSISYADISHVLYAVNIKNATIPCSNLLIDDALNYALYFDFFNVQQDVVLSLMDITITNSGTALYANNDNGTLDINLVRFQTDGTITVAYLSAYGADDTGAVSLRIHDSVLRSTTDGIWIDAKNVGLLEVLNSELLIENGFYYYFLLGSGYDSKGDMSIILDTVTFDAIGGALFADTAGNITAEINEVNVHNMLVFSYMIGMNVDLSVTNSNFVNCTGGFWIAAATGADVEFIDISVVNDPSYVSSSVLHAPLKVTVTNGTSNILLDNVTFENFDYGISYEAVSGNVSLHATNAVIDNIAYGPALSMVTYDGSIDVQIDGVKVANASEGFVFDASTISDFEMIDSDFFSIANCAMSMTFDTADLVAEIEGVHAIDIGSFLDLTVTFGNIDLVITDSVLHGNYAPGIFLIDATVNSNSLTNGFVTLTVVNSVFKNASGGIRTWSEELNPIDLTTTLFENITGEAMHFDVRSGDLDFTFAGDDLTVVNSGTGIWAYANNGDINVDVSGVSINTLEFGVLLEVSSLSAEDLSVINMNVLDSVFEGGAYGVYALSQNGGVVTIDNTQFLGQSVIGYWFDSLFGDMEVQISDSVFDGSSAADETVYIVEDVENTFQLIGRNYWNMGVDAWTGGSELIDLPFTFTYNGVGYTEVLMSEDGWLEFAPGEGIMPVGDTDLMYNYEEFFGYKVAADGTSVMFNWYASEWYSGWSLSMAFQVVLFADGTIQFNYADMEAHSYDVEYGLVTDDSLVYDLRSLYDIPKWETDWMAILFTPLTLSDGMGALLSMEEGNIDAVITNSTVTSYMGGGVAVLSLNGDLALEVTGNDFNKIVGYDFAALHIFDYNGASELTMADNTFERIWGLAVYLELISNEGGDKVIDVSDSVFNKVGYVFYSIVGVVDDTGRTGDDYLNVTVNFQNNVMTDAFGMVCWIDMYLYDPVNWIVTVTQTMTDNVMVQENYMGSWPFMVSYPMSSALGSAVYIEQYYEDENSVTLDQTATVTGNHIECPGPFGIDVGNAIYNYYGDTTRNAVIDVTDNLLNISGYYGIDVWSEMGTGVGNVFDDTSITIENNEINDGLQTITGIYVYVSVDSAYDYDLDQSGDADITGYVSISNNLVEGANLGIYSDIWYYQDDVIGDWNVALTSHIDGNQLLNVSYAIDAYMYAGPWFTNHYWPPENETAVSNFVMNYLYTVDDNVVVCPYNMDFGSQMIYVEIEYWAWIETGTLSLAAETYAWITGTLSISGNQLTEVDGDLSGIYLYHYVGAQKNSWIWVDVDVAVEDNTLLVIWENDGPGPRPPAAIEIYNEVDVESRDEILVPCGAVIDMTWSLTGNNVDSGFRYGIEVYDESDIDDGLASLEYTVAWNISGNTLTNLKEAGIYYEFDEDPEASGTYEIDVAVDITNNIISLVDGPDNWVGIYLDSCDDNNWRYWDELIGNHSFVASVNGNTVSGAEYGMEIYGTLYFGVPEDYVPAEDEVFYSYVNDIVVENNYVYDCYEGMYLEDGMVVRNNIIDCGIGFENYGIYWYEAEGEMVGNTITAEIGVYVDYLHNWLVQGNLIQFGETGMYIYEYDYEEMTDGVIMENTITALDNPFLPWSSTGIYLDYVPNVLISNNVISGADYGVDMYDVWNITIEGNEISDAYESGIYVYYAWFVWIEDNTITGCYDGLYISSYVEDLVVGNNTFVANYYGIYMWEEVHRMVLWNNVFIDNEYGTEIYSYLYMEVVWYVDAQCQSSRSGIYFTGPIFVLAGGSMVVEDTWLDVWGGFTVDEGGLLSLSDVYVDECDFIDVAGTFWATLSVFDETDVNLGPTAEAEIRTSSFYWSEMLIDGSAPVIADNLFVGYGDEYGIVVVNGASPSIVSNIIALYGVGIYANGMDMGGIYDNLIVGNSMAGLLAESCTGAIHDNIFLLNKVEILLRNSDVSVEDNEIGYTNIFQVIANYAPLLGHFVSLGDDTETTTADPQAAMDAILDSSWTDMGSWIKAHNGIWAEGSTVSTSGNVYGLLNYALYAVDSEIHFADDVRTNVLNVPHANDGEMYNYSLNLYTYNGLYAARSQVWVDGSTIEVLDDALVFESSDAWVEGATLLAGDFDYFIFGGSDVYNIATTYAKAKVMDSHSLNEGTWLTITFLDEGDPAVNVTVLIKNAKGEIVYNGTTDAEGKVRILLIQYSYTSEGKDDGFNPYTITADFESGEKSVDVTLDQSYQDLTIEGEEESDMGAILAVVGVLVIILLIVAAVVVMRRRK